VTDHIVIGGAGFIGSHLVRRLLAGDDGAGVTVFDNFSSGPEGHLEPVAGDPRLRIVRGDIKDLDGLTEAVRGHATAFLLASNPDVARAATEPATATCGTRAGRVFRPAASGLDLRRVKLVLYGDTYLRVDYADVDRAAAGRRGLITALRNEGRWDTSNAIFRRRACGVLRQAQSHARHAV